MASFLIEIVGLSPARVDELKNATRSYDALAVVSATLPREAAALARADPAGLARAVAVPALLLLGGDSPDWAREITGALAAALPAAEQVTLRGQGHDAVDGAPWVVVAELERYLGTAGTARPGAPTGDPRPGR